MNRGKLQFTAEFLCANPECQKLNEVRTFTAIVQGPGYEHRCPYCLQMYVVTEHGAEPMNLTVPRTYQDAIGVPFRVALRQDAPIEPNLKGSTDGQGREAPPA